MSKELGEFSVTIAKNRQIETLCKKIADYLDSIPKLEPIAE
jgi:hypothetical protein